MDNNNSKDSSDTTSKPEGRELSDYAGEKVTAYCGEFPRSEGFPTGMSVCGELEYNADRDQYRILVETGNYAYFTSEDVVEIRAASHHTFEDGGEAVIFLDLQQEVHQ
jgi:hypothetical protein